MWLCHEATEGGGSRLLLRGVCVALRASPRASMRIIFGSLKQSREETTDSNDKGNSICKVKWKHAWRVAEEQGQTGGSLSSLCFLTAPAKLLPHASCASGVSGGYLARLERIAENAACGA